MKTMSLSVVIVAVSMMGCSANHGPQAASTYGAGRSNELRVYSLTGETQKPVAAQHHPAGAGAKNRPN